MAKRSIKAEYRETGKFNYRQEGNVTNIPPTCTSIECNEYRTSYDGQIDTSRHKRAVGIQYKHESKEDIAGFIPKPVARPEYGSFPSFPNCDNYGALSTSNPDPRLDNTPTNDNELHQIICNNFKIDYF